MTTALTHASHAPERIDGISSLATLLNRPTRNTRCSCGREFTQTKLNDQWQPAVCLVCVGADLAAERARDEAERARRRRDEALRALDIPLLYRGAGLDTFRLHGTGEDQRRQARVLQLARRFVACWPERQDVEAMTFPQVVIFRGAPGSGKGHVAWSIARTIAGTYGDRVLFTVLSDCIRDLREAWNQGRGEGPSESERLARYRRADLLVVDEVSRHAFRGEPTQHLYDLVAWREQRLMPTILTSNESVTELAALLGPAIESRAAGWGNVWDFGEDDFRVIRRQLRAQEVA